MAPGLRSGRTGRPGEVGAGGAETGGCSEPRTDAGGERRAVRSRWRRGAAGMLANCLLSVGMLSLLARCALAAEEKSTYDASGSSSLPGDPAVTAAPARPSPDLSAGEEVPFSVVRSESEGKALSGQPAFSSVVTVMAGTVQHPVSLGPSRTVARDDTQTTQWPSRSFSQGSETSRVGDRIHSTSSGLTGSMFHHLSTSNDGPSPPSPSSIPSVLPSFVSLFPLSPPTEWITKSFGGQRPVSSPARLTAAATLSPAGSRVRTGPRSLPPSVADPPAATVGLEGTTTRTFQRETSSENSNEVTESFSNRSATNTVQTFTQYTSSHHVQNVSKLGPVQNQHLAADPGTNNTHRVLSSAPFNQSNRQVGGAATPSAPSAHLKGDLVSSRVKKKTSSQTAHSKTEDSQASVPRVPGETVASPPARRAVNPASPAVAFSPAAPFITVSSEAPPGKASFFQSAITEPTPIRSGSASSEHASNPGDLPTAAGQGGPRDPAIKMSYNQGGELRPLPSGAQQNNSLSLGQSKPESTSVSAFGSFSRSRAVSTMTDADSPSFTINEGINDGDAASEPQSPKGTRQEATALPSDIRSMFHSGSHPQVGLAESYRTSPVTSYLSPSSISLSPNHSIDQNAAVPASNQVKFAEESKPLSFQISPSPRPFQTPSLLMLSRVLETTLQPSKPPRAVSSVGSVSTVDVETGAGHELTPPFSSAPKPHKAKPAASLQLNPAEPSVSASLDHNNAWTLIREAAFHSTTGPSGRLTARFPYFITIDDAFTSSSSGGPPGETPSSPAAADVALEAVKGEDDATLMSRHAQPPPSSWSEINSQAPITGVSGDKTGFSSWRQASSLSTASSAAATSPSHRENSSETLGAIFASYTKRQATRPESFQSGAFESENTSTRSDGADFNLAADGSSHEHRKPGNQHKRNVHALNSTDPTAVASDPHSAPPTAEQRSSQSANPSPDNRGADVAAPSVWGFEGRTTDSQRSSPVPARRHSDTRTSEGLTSRTRPPSPSSSPSTFPSLPPPPSTDLHHLTDTFSVPTEAEPDEFSAATSRAVALTFPKEASVAPSASGRTSQVPPLPPPQDATTASVKLATTTADPTTKTKSPAANMPSLSATTASTQAAAPTTAQPVPVTTRTSTTTTSKTIRTQTSRRTFAPPAPRTSPPRGAVTSFVSPFTTTTEVPPQQCNITERMWVKTVVSIYVRRNRLDSIQRQNLRRGLSQGLRKALNDSSAQAQVETVFGSPNMTVAYHVTGGDVVYPPSVVLDGLDSYGRDKLIADLRQYLPMVTALPLPVALWRPVPAGGFQLKTVLQFVGAGDEPRSCRFSQMMEQRLEKVFSEAQAKVLHTNSRLSVQMLSVSQAPGSPAVSLVYTVRNGSVFLNGTTASNLLGQLSAELVGYFLFYPPLVIAEPLEYHNLNTSIATRDFWVITVIQDVDNASLEAQYQSFASLMEQRLAELFVLASQQGTRFRRATTVGSYTVQMVSIRRVSGLKNPAEMTYYIQHSGVPLSGSSAAKTLNTVDSQTMALTLGYFVQLQAEPVVKNPPNNLWIIAAVLAPIAVVTLIIIIITAVLCRKNKNDFKADAIGNLNPRAKMAYRRDVGYYHQPVQGFDYAKQHLGQQGGDEETLPASQDTLVMSLQIRDQPLSLEKVLQQDGTANKKSLTTDKHKSKLPSEDGSVISNESEKLNSSRGLTAAKVTAQQKLAKEATRKRDDPYDTSSGSLQLISIKPVASQSNQRASSDRSQDLAIINGEVNLALKQKSDIEHYRNKLRLKAKRKGYYDFPSTDGSSSGPALVQRPRQGPERAAGEHGRPSEPDDERGSTYVKSHRRHSQVGQTAYRSRQSLSSPSPGGTEMDLLVMRERPRRGIRNSGYDTEPELIEETNVDRLMGPRGYMYGRGLKGHSETSTLSSQPSIDEVRQQMHLLLEEAFSLASGGQSTSGRHSHHHHPTPDHYNPAPPPLPYADVVTSAPGTMSSGRGGLQWVPSYGADIYQCSLPKPAFRFTQLPEMAVGSPPPLPPRTGPPSGSPLRRSTSDLGLKGRNSKTSVTEMQSQHDNNPYGPSTRAALPSITAEQPVSNYSGNPITAVYAIPASRSGYSEYFVSTPPTSYHSPSWMSYPPEPEDVPPQWADSVPLPGYVEAFPHPRYPQGSPTRLPLEYNQSLEQPSIAPNAASQQSLPQSVKNMDSMPLSSLSTSALVQAIRQEVAKLAKKQNDMFEF